MENGQKCQTVHRNTVACQRGRDGAVTDILAQRCEAPGRGETEGLRLVSSWAVSVPTTPACRSNVLMLLYALPLLRLPGWRAAVYFLSAVSCLVPLPSSFCRSALLHSYLRRGNEGSCFHISAGVLWSSFISTSIRCSTLPQGQTRSLPSPLSSFLTSPPGDFRLKPGPYLPCSPLPHPPPPTPHCKDRGPGGGLRHGTETKQSPFGNRWNGGW